MQVDVSTDAVEGHLAGTLLRLYHAAFEPLEIVSPARQSFTDEEFLAQLASENVVKFVAREGESIGGLALIATDLTEVPWISPRYFEHTFPDQYAKGLVHCVTVLFLTEERRSTIWTSTLLEEMLRRTAARSAYLAMDMCRANVDRGLPGRFDRAARNVCAEVGWDQLDTQTYFGLKMGGPR